VRAALAARGFDWTAGRLLNPDEGAYTEARATFRRWHEAWLAHGHDAVLAPLVARLAPALAQREDGARRLTDLRHLAERLGAAPVSADAPASLLAWLAERMGAREITEEADALRPEAGEKRVRVMTAHKSKGLEFGVVFLPLAWQPPVSDRDPVVAFHDDAAQVCLDLAPEPDGDSRTRARAEQLADAVRVAYVTLTRARHRTYAVTGRIWYHSGGGSAGIAQILLGEGADNYDRLDQAAWDAAIGARVRQMNAGTALAHLPLPRPSRRRLDPGPPPALPEAAELSRELPRIEPTWSYSALKRLGNRPNRSLSRVPAPRTSSRRATTPIAAPALAAASTN
jgi:exodeoxyribonuclease V beta subunit